MAMCQAGCEGCFTDYPCLIIRVSYTTQNGQIAMAALHENDYALSNKVSMALGEGRFYVNAGKYFL